MSRIKKFIGLFLTPYLAGVAVETIPFALKILDLRTYIIALIALAVCVLNIIVEIWKRKHG
jgi:hypothetical protein